MVRSPQVRRFIRGRRGIVESYRACWHGRGFPPEKLCVRVDRYRERCEIAAEVSQQDERGEWQPARTQVRPLSVPEWEQVRAWVETGFWRQPSRDTAAAVLDGDGWRIDGYRDGSYHEVYRHTGSLVDGGGAEVYELGRRFAGLAGLRSFEE